MTNKNGYIHANRAGWEKAEPVHRKARFDQLKVDFQNPEFLYLTQVALPAVRRLGVAGKSVVQLMCNNGRELISLKRLGAARCVGIDFSISFLRQAHELCDITNLECEFLCCEVSQVPTSLFGQFDMVFISSGSLRWIEDLGCFFEKIKQLLKTGGTLLLTEMHPILNMIDNADYDVSPRDIKYSYFHKDPIRDTRGLDYWNQQPYDAPPVYYFQHTLGEIFTLCFAHRLAPLHFNEHHIDLSGGWYTKRGDFKFPLSYSLVAQRH